MKYRPLALFLASVVLVTGFGRVAHAQNSDAEDPKRALAEARAELVEAYKRGERDDSSNNVKQLRARIAAMEYILQNSAAVTDPAGRLVTVNFPGGSFASLLDAINKSGGG